MTREQIEKTVAKYIIDSQNGLEIENPKVDFKRQWYDLSDSDGINEFLKDTTAIANTVGFDGYIIIGFDDKKNEFYDATFSNSKLKDSSQIPDIIIRGCSNLFDVNTYDIEYQGKLLSIIQIPLTLEKPVFIKNYTKKKGETGIEHRVFVRKNTAVRPASKYDIEMMFYDRKNSQPEYDFDMQIIEIGVINRFQSSTKLEIGIRFYYENIGRKSISILSLTLRLKTKSYDVESLEMLNLLTLSKDQNENTNRIYFDFENQGTLLDEIRANLDFKIHIVIKMSNGKLLFKDFDHIPYINFGGFSW
jgi:hypothetical protein